jgi:thermitase
MAVVVLMLTVVASAMADSADGGRFVPNEILVKFRAPQAADANGLDVVSSAADAGLSRATDPSDCNRRSGIREMRRLVRGEQPQRRIARSWEGESGSGLSSRERRVLRRQRRIQGFADVGGERFDTLYRIRVNAGVDVEELLAAYRSRDDVEYAEFNPIISIGEVPDDPSYGQQWSLRTIEAPLAWDVCRGDNAVVVAIIDTGVDYNHRDLLGNLWVNEAEQNGVAGMDDDGNGYIDDVYGYNFVNNSSDPMDDHGHGTHCAGIVAAVGDNGLDVAGVCWKARIMSLKVLGADGNGSAGDAVPAIYYAVANGADIISGSWGATTGSDAVKDAIAYAYSRGVIVVAAAGNDGEDVPYYPAAYPNVLSVAATDSSDRRWYSSNYGDWVDVAAPGREILSLGLTSSRQYTAWKTGTSMAAPHVSGACALLLSADPLLTCDEVQEIVTSTGDPIAAGICSSNSRLNVYEALRAAIPSAGFVRLDQERYGRDSRVGIFLADWDLRGAGQQTVLVESGGGDEEIVTLAETDASRGVFRGDLLASKTVVTAGDGVLQLEDGQSITIRYLDADDGLGNVDQWREAVAAADFNPPAILDVQIDVSGVTATIDLLTDEAAIAEVRYAKISGGPYDLTKNESGLGELHSIRLNGLSPQTAYYFVIAVTDEAGNKAVLDNAGQPYSFITSGRPRR